VRTLADMEYYGFKVNVDALVEFSKELQEKIDVVTKEIYTLAEKSSISILRNSWELFCLRNWVFPLLRKQKPDIQPMLKYWKSFPTGTRPCRNTSLKGICPVSVVAMKIMRATQKNNMS